MSAVTEAPDATANAEKLKRSLEFQTIFNGIIERIHSAEDFAESMPIIEQDMLRILRAERMTVYRKGRTQQEIVSQYKSGDDIQEIRVPLSTSSIAGYVALSQKAILLEDVYQDEALKRIHPKLSFDQSFDQQTKFRTRSMMVLPIKFKDVLLGVVQILNRIGGGAFSRWDLENAHKLATVIGQKFRYELNGTQGPYDYLIQRKQITTDQLAQCTQQAEQEHVHISEILHREYKLSFTEIGSSLEHYYQVPYCGYDPNVEISPDLLAGLKENYLRKQLWVPLSRSLEEIVILIDDPTDTQRIMEIQRVVDAERFVFKVGLPSDILRYLGQGGVVDGGANLGELVDRLDDEIGGVEDISEMESTVDENEATVIQLVNQLILDAYRERASDIHIEPGKGKQASSVRLRIDGVCRSSLKIPSSHIRAVVSRIKIMSGLDIAERRKPQDGKCAVRFRGQPIELRVATIPTVNGESVVLRILAASEPLPVEKLNLSERNISELKKLVVRPHGIMLVVGPTGSGKTTTLHAVLGHINTPERKIWTAEDPVEITQSGLQQVQVLPKIGFDFAAALRSFLRADPDVIMIGEMRDRETASSGIEASLTGHMVFSTLHTNSAAETVTRLLDMGIDPISFSDALLGVLAQRLVRTLCDKCKQAYQPTTREIESLIHYYGEQYFDELNVDRAGLTLYKAKGCEHCAGSGYRGRTGVHELLVSSPEMIELIYKNATAGEIHSLSVQQGMRTLMQDGIAKLLRGQTDIEQIMKVASH